MISRLGSRARSGALRRSAVAGIGVLGVAGLVLAGTGSAYAGTGTATTVTVRSVDLVGGAPGPGQFAVINQSGRGGGVQMASGPATPPLGAGSLAMSVTGTKDHWSAYTDDWAGTPLSAVTGISYSTYTDNTTTAPTFQVVIDPGAPSAAGTKAGCPTEGYSTLNFEPYLNTAQQALESGVWQKWDVTASGGVVWGTHLLPCTPEAPAAATGGGIDWATLNTYYPDATILAVSSGGGLGLNVGSGWSAMTGNADALRVATASRAVTYNFEPGPARTTLTTSASLLGPFTATLTRTSTGAPIAGQTVDFTANLGGGSVCSATTDSHGVASCSGGLLGPLYVLTGYRATFPGTSGYQPATAKG